MGGGYVPPHLRGSRGASASASARARGKERARRRRVPSRRRRGGDRRRAREPRCGGKEVVSRRRGRRGVDARCADGGVARDPQRVGGRDERLAGVLGGEPGQKARRDPGAGGVSVRDRVGDARRRARRAAGTLSARRRGRVEGAARPWRCTTSPWRCSRACSPCASSTSASRRRWQRRRSATPISTRARKSASKARQRPDPERGLARDRRRRARVFGERAGGDRRDFREQRGARPRAAGVAARRANAYDASPTTRRSAPPPRSRRTIGQSPKTRLVARRPPRRDAERAERAAETRARASAACFDAIWNLGDARAETRGVPRGARDVRRRRRVARRLLLRL